MANVATIAPQANEDEDMDECSEFGEDGHPLGATDWDYLDL